MNPISVETTLRIIPPTTAAMIASTPKSGGKPPTLKLRSELVRHEREEQQQPAVDHQPEQPEGHQRERQRQDLDQRFDDGVHDPEDQADDQDGR